MAKPWRIGVWSSTGEFIIRASSFASSSHHIVCIYTNSEESLLLDETADNVDKALVAATVVHEAAHQWFGNLVTSTWWDDIWLNEGMTTLFESIILAEVICWYFGCSRGINNYVETFLKKVAPDVEFKTVTLVFLHEVMRNDLLVGSHPLNAPVTDFPAIDDKFDFVAYAKGIRSLRDDSCLQSDNDIMFINPQKERQCFEWSEVS